jgi:hypothetical protein
LIILNLKKRQNDSRGENESKSSLQSLTRKEIKNPSEKKIRRIFVLFATKTTTCYAGGKGKALARKEVTK